MFLADMPDVIRMEFRDALEDAGVEIDGYDGEYFRVALPCPSSPVISQLVRDGWDVSSIHYFPLGSDSPPAEFRHDGRYRGSKGFWLYAMCKPPIES